VVGNTKCFAMFLGAFCFCHIFKVVKKNKLNNSLFSSCWLADQFISLTMVLIDLEMTLCTLWIYFGGSGDCVLLASGAYPFLVAFPYVWRFMQCIRQYYDTKMVASLLNAGKYLTSLVVIFFATLDRSTKGHAVEGWTKWYHSYWIIFMTISSFYSFAWDTIMDWGLFSFESRNWLLRDNLMYERPVLYYFAVVSNLLMRMTWLLLLVPNFVGTTWSHDAFASALAGIEIIRRIQWNFLRVEYEHINNLLKSNVSRQHSSQFFLDGGGEVYTV